MPVMDAQTQQSPQSRRSPLVRSRLSASASIAVVRSASASPGKSKLPSLTPNSKRAVSRLSSRVPTRDSASSFTLDLEGVKPCEEACYSPLRRSLSPEAAPQQVQCVGNYDLGKTIGRGRFGKVKVATHVLTGQQVAVKIIRKKNLTAVEAALLRREVDILKRLNHPNIIKLYEVLETERVLFLIMEYASGGEVLDFIVAHKKLAENRARELFRQIVSAFAHIHKNNVVHRDLKAENILLDENLNIKIIDFGLSNFFEPSKLLKTPCGSPSYAAPELIRKVEYDGPAADIWSIGVNLYVLVCGVLPFKPTDLVNLYDKVLKGEYTLPDFLSDECKDLLTKLIVVNPADRLTVTSILEHPWVKDPSGQPLIVPGEEEDEVADPAIIEEMVRVGFNEDIARQSVKRNSYNPASATFSILMDRKRKSMQNHKMVHRVHSAMMNEEGRLDEDHSLFARPQRMQPFPRKVTSDARVQRRDVSRYQMHKRNKSHDWKGVVPMYEDNGKPMKKEHSLPPDLSLPNIQRSSDFPSPPKASIPRQSASAGDSSPLPTTFAQRRMMRHVGHRRAHSVDIKPTKDEIEETPGTTPIFEEMFEEARGSSNDTVMCAPASAPSSVAQLSLPSVTAAPAVRIEARNGRSLTDRMPRPKTLTEEEAEEWNRAAAEEQRELAAYLEKPAEELDDSQSRKAFKMILSYTKRLLNKRAADEQQAAEPRQARAAFANTMRTSMHPDAIMPILEAKLAEMGLEFDQEDAFCLKVVSVSQNVQFEVEICRMPRLTDMYCIRTKRVGGDWESYRNICDRLHSALETDVA